jgi:hypothetical protein
MTIAPPEPHEGPQVEEPTDADYLVATDDDMPTDWTPRRKVRAAIYTLAAYLAVRFGLDVDDPLFDLLGPLATVAAAYAVRDN